MSALSGVSGRPLAGAARRLINLILPVACAGCGSVLADDPVPFFCRACWATLTPLTGPSCPRCGRPFSSPVTLTYSPEHLCAACRRTRPAFTRAWSLYGYTAPLEDAIRLFKYRRKVALADALGDLMQRAFQPPGDTDVVMPVPLHPDRLREREFNQSLLLADRVTRGLGLPLSYDNLIRLRPTQAQTDLSRKARLKNLRRAFGLVRPKDIVGTRILLVDDVFTTGTTVNECAKALRRAGAAAVYVVTLARTV